MNDFGKTIARYRKERGLNQSQLAEELKDYNICVKQNTVSAWESGITQPSAKQLLAICEILDIYDVSTIEIMASSSSMYLIMTGTFVYFSCCAAYFLL